MLALNSTVPVISPIGAIHAMMAVRHPCPIFLFKLVLTSKKPVIFLNMVYAKPSHKSVYPNFAIPTQYATVAGV